MPSTSVSKEASLVLDSAVIEERISPKILQKMDALEVFDCIRSTQEYVKNQIPSNRLCVAERQLAGKGRRGRQWLAASRGDVLLSLSWMFDSIPDGLAGLSLAVVAEVAELLSTRYSVPVKIKWPNDLLLSDAKLAGFIVDLETGSRCRVTIGLGLNVAVKDEEVLKGIDQPVASLLGSGIADVNRNYLVAEIVERLVALLMVYPDVGFTAYKTKWENYAAHIGKNVVLQRRGKQEAEVVVSGIFEGIDEHGSLCICEPSGERHKIVDSELSLRLL